MDAQRLLVNAVVTIALLAIVLNLLPQSRKLLLNV